MNEEKENIVRCEECGNLTVYPFVYFTPILDWVHIFCSQSCKEECEKRIEGLGSLFSC